MFDHVKFGVRRLMQRRTKDVLPIFLSISWIPRRAYGGVAQEGPRRLMAHWARSMGKETNETENLNNILAEGTVARNVVCCAAEGPPKIAYGVGKPWGKGIASGPWTNNLPR